MTEFITDSLSEQGEVTRRWLFKSLQAAKARFGQFHAYQQKSSQIDRWNVFVKHAL